MVSIGDKAKLLWKTQEKEIHSTERSLTATKHGFRGYKNTLQIAGHSQGLSLGEIRELSTLHQIADFGKTSGSLSSFGGTIAKSCAQASAFPLSRGRRLWRRVVFMPLQQHHIDELKKIHQEDFGEDLSDKEAWEMGTRLVNLFRLLLKTDPKPKDGVRTK